MFNENASLEELILNLDDILAKNNKEHTPLSRRHNAGSKFLLYSTPSTAYDYVASAVSHSYQPLTMITSKTTPNPASTTSGVVLDAYTQQLTPTNASLNTNDFDIHDRIDRVVARINLGSMLFGIVGNFICICVLMQKPLLKRKFNWYLLLLALTDLIFSAIVFINYYIVYNNPAQALYDLSWVTCYFTDYIVNSLDAFCVFLTLLLSVDRLYAIMKPIKSKMFFTYRYPKRIAVIGYLALLVIRSPELFLSQREYITQNDTGDLSNADNTTLSSILNTSSLSPLPSSAYFCHSSVHEVKDKEEKKRIIYILVCNIIIPLLFNIIPAFIILGLNLTLWCFIRHYTHVSQMNKINSQNNNNNHNHNHNNCGNKSFAFSQKISLTNGVGGGGHQCRQQTRQSNVSNGSNSISYTAALSKSRVTKAQKSYYFTIIMLGIWLIFTTIPYYSLFTYYWASSLSLINDRSRLHMTVQAVSSAFFNSNHCINIAIYLLFHKDFRSNAFRIACQVFNLNPLCKLNPHYFDSINNAGRPSHYELTYTTAIANQARLTEPSNNEINLNRLRSLSNPKYKKLNRHLYSNVHTNNTNNSSNRTASVIPSSSPVAPSSPPTSSKYQSPTSSVILKRFTFTSTAPNSMSMMSGDNLLTNTTTRPLLASSNNQHNMGRKQHLNSFADIDGDSHVMGNSFSALNNYNDPYIRQQFLQYAAINNRRLFMPNPKLLKWFGATSAAGGGGGSSRDKESNSSEENNRHDGVDDGQYGDDECNNNNNNEQRKLSVELGGVHKAAAKAAQKLSMKPVKKTKSFWTKFTLFRFFSRKK